MSFTVHQIVKKKKKLRIKKSNKKALLSCPQRKGICLKVFKMAPKKPNSAKRKVLKVSLTTKQVVHVHAPGETYGDNLQQFSWVLIRGGRVRDLPGIQYRAIRNKFDFKGISSRRNGRSKYGTCNWDKINNQSVTTWQKREI